MQKKGVLLVNMGGPLTLSEMKLFLKNMFNDKHILPMHKFPRSILSTIISTIRYRKSWQKYKLIGGSPLQESTSLTAKALSTKLKDYTVRFAFSYSTPLFDDVLQEFSDNGFSQIFVIPMYPHDGITSFSSVVDSCNKFQKTTSTMTITVAKPYYNNPLFIKFWEQLITTHVEESKTSVPTLLFSGHSIPMKFVHKGDPYPEQVKMSAELIALSCELPYKISFQSQMTLGKWLKPETTSMIKQLEKEKVDSIVIVPISFICENLETMYDVDNLIIPYAKKNVKLKSISRIKIPKVSDTFVDLLFDLVKKQDI